MATPNDVNVYDVNTGYRESLGKSVMPAALLPVDFSALDKALKTEEDIANKALGTMTSNLESLGKIQDELTNIPLANPYHEQQLAIAKKETGISDDAFKGVISNMDNPTATFDLDRKIKKLYTNARVKNIGYENAIVENFKANLPTISDPNLRAKAIGDLTKAFEDTSGTAIKDLNLSMYETLDLASAYKAVIDQYAPLKQTSVRKVDDAGNSYTDTEIGRDPNAVRKAQNYFKKNKKVENNLIAQGIMADDGELIKDEDDKTWFDIIEAGELQQGNKISDVKGTTQTKEQAVLTPPSDLAGLDYTPNLVDGFDIGVISAVETSNRGISVHADSSTQPQVNFGAYSFNKGVASDFFQSLKDTTGSNEKLNKAVDDLAGMDIYDTSKGNVALLKKAYKKIEDIMGTDKLTAAENSWAVQQFGAPVVDHADELGIEVSDGGKTFLMDAAIHHGQPLVVKWINEFEKDAKGAASLEDYILRKRLETITKTGKIKAADKPAVSARVWRVYKATMGEKPSTDAPAEDGTTTPSDSTGVDMSVYDDVKW